MFQSPLPMPHIKFLKAISKDKDLRQTEATYIHIWKKTSCNRVLKSHQISVSIWASFMFGRYATAPLTTDHVSTLSEDTLNEEGA